jgi:hypothetical protein
VCMCVHAKCVGVCDCYMESVVLRKHKANNQIKQYVENGVKIFAVT